MLYYICWEDWEFGCKKSNLNVNINIYKCINCLINMKTTLTVEKETLRNLNLIKYAMGTGMTMDDVINKLILSYKTKKEDEI